MKAFLSKYRQYAGLLLAAVLVGIDQWTKWLVSTNMQLNGSPINLLEIGGKEVLNLYYCTNNGTAFSMLEGKTTFLIVITSAVILVLIAGLLLKKINRPEFVVSVSLIIGGGVGNLIDRLFRNGSVIDFIDVRIINFAIFNFADICAVVGGILMCLFVIIDEVKESKEKNARKAAEAENEAQDGEPGGNGEN